MDFPEENTETININTGWWHNESQVNIHDLAKIEISIIASMFQSKELFHKITSMLKQDDFTFGTTAELFRFLIPYLTQNEVFGNKDEVFEIALSAYNRKECSIYYAATMKILASKPRRELDLDLVELLEFSKNRKEILSRPAQDSITDMLVEIDDIWGNYTVFYRHGIVTKIYCSYIFHTPEELCDVFIRTFENMTSFTQKEDSSLGMIYNDDTPNIPRCFKLVKQITEINKLEKIISWAIENKIEQINIPSSRGYLADKNFFELDNKGLKTIPKEFCEVFTKTFLLDISNNELSALPRNINLLQLCLLLALCNNNIEHLPRELFEIKRLTTLCLGNNKIQLIPSEIGNLSNLETLILSDNPISKLPASFTHLTKLYRLDMENTLIEEDSLEHIILENMKQISFNDKLLPFFIKNIHRLQNIDTINLYHSNYKATDPEISSLGLCFEDEEWMDKESYMGNGCVVLKGEK